MLETITKRLHDLAGTLDRLETLLADPGAAGRLPGLTLARTVLALDQAAGRLVKLVDQLAAASVQPGRPPEVLRNVGQRA